MGNKQEQLEDHAQLQSNDPTGITEIHWIAHMTGTLQWMDTSTQERKAGKARGKRVALCAKG